MTKLLELAAGIGLVVLGIIGLILPIMPGWVFLIPGLVILSRHFHWAKRLLDWARQKAGEAKDKLEGGARKSPQTPPEDEVEDARPDLRARGTDAQSEEHRR